MSDDDKQAPGMSDEARALAAGKRARTPGGVPIVDTTIAQNLVELAQIETDLQNEARSEWDDEFTPIREILELAGRDVVLRNIVAGLWKHSANQELRFRRQRNYSDEGRMREDVDANTASILDISGKNGSNGKLGEIKRRVDTLTSKAWLVLIAAIGSIGAAAVKLVIVTRAFSDVENRAARSADEIKLLQAQVLTLQAAQITRPRYRPEPPAESTQP